MTIYKTKIQQDSIEVDFSLSGELVPSIEQCGLTSPSLANLEPWQYAQYAAIANWIITYQPDPGASRLETVRGYLEAAYHCDRLEAWDMAAKIANFVIDNTNYPLHTQLGIWGYYQEQIELCQRLLDKVDNTTKLDYLSELGVAFFDMCKPQIAIQYSQRELKVAQAMDDKVSIGRALSELSRACFNAGNREASAKYAKKQMELAQSIQDQTLEVDALVNLHYGYEGKRRSTECLSKALALSQEINSPGLEEYVLSNMGSNYAVLGDHQNAIIYIKRQIKLLDKIRRDPARYPPLNPKRNPVKSYVFSLCSLGGAYVYRKDSVQAKHYLDQALVLIKENKQFRNAEHILYAEFAGLYNYVEKDYEKGIEYLQAALRLSKDTGNQVWIAHIEANLAFPYACLGEYSTAMSYVNRALKVAKENSLNYLGSSCRNCSTQLTDLRIALGGC